jgi:hypothetical protein
MAASTSTFNRKSPRQLNFVYLLNHRWAYDLLFVVSSLVPSRGGELLFVKEEEAGDCYIPFLIFTMW